MMSKPNLMTKALAISFLLNGILFGAWVARISFFKVHYDLNKAEISILLLLLALGAFCAFLFSSKLSARFGAHHLTFYCSIGYALFFIGLGLSSTLVIFSLSLFLFGAFHGAMDVAMNTWASEIEKTSKKRIMPTLHAIFSLGGALGAASTIPFTYWQITPFWHFVALIIICSPSMFWLIRSLKIAQQPNIDNAKIKAKTKDKKSVFANNSLLIISLVASGCALGEGAIADWASIYMFQEISTNQAFGAIAYSIFSTVMVISRLSANHLLNAIGTVKSIELCAIASCIGTVILLLTQSILMSLVGFALLGFGYSIIMPLAFSKAANLSTTSNSSAPTASSAIATVAAFAYGAMLLDPVAIGVIAEVSSLRAAFSLFAFFAAFTFFAAYCFKDNQALSSHKPAGKTL